MERVSTWDLSFVLLAGFPLLFLMSWSLKYSLIGSVFLLVNVYALARYLALSPADPTQVQEFFHDNSVGAHRGLAQDAPENTLGAFRQAKELGAQSVEFDLEFTADGVPVLLHDDTVDRTTDGTGPISQMSFNDCQKLNAAAKFPNKELFPFEKIPKLEEGLKQSLDLGLKIYIDVKNHHEKLIPTLLEMYRKYPELYKMAAVCSFWPLVVYEVKKADSRILTGHTWRPGFFAYSDVPMRESRWPGRPLHHLAAELLDRVWIWTLHNVAWKLSGANLLLTQHASISERYVEMWRGRGLQVVAWTVNDKYKRLFFEKGVAFPFLTDRLSDHLKDV